MNATLTSYGEHRRHLPTMTLILSLLPHPCPHVASPLPPHPLPKRPSLLRCNHMRTRTDERLVQPATESECCATPPANFLALPLGAGPVAPFQGGQASIMLAGYHVAQLAIDFFSGGQINFNRCFIKIFVGIEHIKTKMRIIIDTRIIYNCVSKTSRQ